MLIDGYEQYTQQDADVVDITPDDAEDGENVALRADDCRAVCTSSDQPILTTLLR